MWAYFPRLTHDNWPENHLNPAGSPVSIFGCRWQELADDSSELTSLVAKVLNSALQMRRSLRHWGLVPWYHQHCDWATQKNDGTCSLANKHADSSAKEWAEQNGRKQMWNWRVTLPIEVSQTWHGILCMLLKSTSTSFKIHTHTIIINLYYIYHFFAEELCFFPPRHHRMGAKPQLVVSGRAWSTDWAPRGAWRLGLGGPAPSWDHWDHWDHWWSQGGSINRETSA